MKHNNKRPPRRQAQRPQQQSSSGAERKSFDRKPERSKSYDRPERKSFDRKPERSKSYDRPERKSFDRKPERSKSYDRPERKSFDRKPERSKSYDRRPARYEKTREAKPVPEQNLENRVFGKNAVLECLNSDTSINKIWMLDSYNPKLKEIEELARAKKIPVLRSPRQELERLAGGEDHRSVVAEISPIKIHEEEFLYREDSTITKIIVAVNIEDPHNLGAILRSAMAFGVDAVVFTARKSTQITSTVISSSAGAALKIPLVRIGNTTDCLLRLKEHGYWIYGTCVDQDKSQPLAKVSFSEKSAVLVGNEGKGLSDKVLKHCDFSVYIPVEFNSLNVSVATGIVLYQMSLHQ